MKGNQIYTRSDRNRYCDRLSFRVVSAVGRSYRSATFCAAFGAGPEPLAHASKQAFATAAGVGCNIKGNISAAGERIYHIPGQRYYSATHINTRRGERWFCTEEEARTAGWRRARI